MKVNLIFFLARFGLGGAGNSIFRLCTSLDKKKYKINIICLNKCAYEHKFIKNKIRVYKIKSNRTLYSMFKLKKLVNKISKNHKDTIFISNINYTNILCALFIEKKPNLKLIAIERTPFQELEIYFNTIDFIKKNIIKILIYFFYNKFDKIICNSRYISNYLRKKYKLKSTTIHPPSLISNKKKQILNKYKFDGKKLNISSICRLSKEKAIQDILYALKYLKQKEINLNIIGDGPEKENLINLTKKLNLNKNVKFYGYKNEIFNILKKTHLYINSSYFEGFPNSVVEAAISGIPIISSQSHGGINEILMNGKYGTIYCKGYLDLASKIKKFYQNPKIFYQKAILARKNVMKFSLLNHKKNFEKMLNNI